MRIGQLGDYEAEKIELRNLHVKVIAEPTHDWEGLASSIDRHFEAPYPTRPYADLWSLYVNASSPYERESVLWAFAKGKHPEALRLMRGLMSSAEFYDDIKPVVAYAEAVQDVPSVPFLAQVYLRGIEKEMQWPILGSLIGLARGSDADLMLAVLKSADAEQATRLSSWFARYPHDEATDILRQLAGSQDVPRWELSRNLAVLKDETVVNWAIHVLSTTPSARDRGIADPWDELTLRRSLALEILTHSPLPRANVMAQTIIQTGDREDHRRLARGFLFSANPHRWDRLREIPDWPAINAASAQALRVRLEELSAEHPEARELLSRLTRP